MIKFISQWQLRRVRKINWVEEAINQNNVWLVYQTELTLFFHFVLWYGYERPGDLHRLNIKATNWIIWKKQSIQYSFVFGFFKQIYSVPVSLNTCWQREVKVLSFDSNAIINSFINHCNVVFKIPDSPITDKFYVQCRSPYTLQLSTDYAWSYCYCLLSQV